MGHGDHRPGEGRGDLILQDHYGGLKRLSAEALATLVRDQDMLKLVFLNACKTARAASTVGHDPFTGLATALVREGLPAVVAMRWAIKDCAAIAFSRSFYCALASGRPVDAATGQPTVLAFWEAVFMQFDNGAVVGGFDALMKAAVKKFPGNQVFRRAAERAVVEGNRQ